MFYFAIGGLREGMCLIKILTEYSLSCESSLGVVNQ